jgi:Flp pilus assembly protein TadD/4-amino-4-deoxy-L-arabinose transferase-like glycosyltransferase
MQSARSKAGTRNPFVPKSLATKPRPEWSARRVAGVAFSVAFCLRLLHLWAVSGTPLFSLLLGDALAYDTWAQAIASGNWLGNGVFYQAPLYPYFLGAVYSVFGHNLVALRVVQVLLGSLGCGLLAVAGQKLFGTRTGLLAGILLAVYPPAIYFDTLIQKAVIEGLLVCALIAAVAGMIQRLTVWRCIGAGAVLGCLALSRENAQLLIPLVLIWAWWHQPRRMVHVLCVALGASAVLAPVVIRNAVVGGEFHLSTSQFGPNLYIGNHEGATGAYDPLRNGHGSVADERADATELAERAAGHPLSPGEVSHYWAGRATSWMLSNPGDWVRLTGRKLLLVLNGVESADTEDIYTHAEASPVLQGGLFVLHFGVLAPLGLWGFWLTRNRWRNFWVFWGLTALYAASVVVFFVLDRYRYPLVPFLALFASAGVIGLPAWWRTSSWHVRTRALLAVGAVAAVCNWPLMPKAPLQAATHYNIGSVLQAAGRDAEAEGEYQRALALVPALPAAHGNLGLLYAARGEQDKALLHYQASLKADDQVGDTHNDLGILLASMGKTNEAVEHLRTAVRLEPRNAAFWYNLGTALAQRSPDEAVKAFGEVLALDPNRADAHNNLGILLASNGHLEAALEHFRAAAALDPGNQQIQANLSRAARLAGGPNL